MRYFKQMLLSAGVVFLCGLLIGTVSAKERFVAHMSGANLEMVKQLPLFNPNVPGEIIGFYERKGPIPTAATGTLTLKIVNNNEIHYKLKASHENFWMNADGTPGIFGASHIHLGSSGAYGPIMFTLYNRLAPGTEPFTGKISGVLTAEDLINVPVGYGPDQPTTLPGYGVHSFEDALAAIRQGNSYVNVHTGKHWLGEIAGNIVPVPHRHKYKD